MPGAFSIPYRDAVFMEILVPAGLELLGGDAKDRGGQGIPTGIVIRRFDTTVAKPQLMRRRILSTGQSL